MTDFLEKGDQQEKAEEVMELAARAATEQASDASNDVLLDGDVSEPAESNAPETSEMTEGDVVPAEEMKEEWREDNEQNDQAQAASVNEQEGQNAFSKARNSWANGWSV